MWQDLHFDSSAHWLVFQFLLHCGSLVHIHKVFYEYPSYVTGLVCKLNVEFTDLCFERNIPQIHLVYLVDN